MISARYIKAPLLTVRQRYFIFIETGLLFVILTIEISPEVLFANFWEEML
jgi:hypothetical protein